MEADLFTCVADSPYICSCSYVDKYCPQIIHNIFNALAVVDNMGQSSGINDNGAVGRDECLSLICRTVFHVMVDYSRFSKCILYINMCT